MLDIKTWLETTDMKVAEEYFKNPPALPYIIFTTSEKVSGADSKNCLADRNISIELYSDFINEIAECKIASLLNEKSIAYKKERIWVDSEHYFQTIYDFNLLEKF